MSQVRMINDYTDLIIFCWSFIYEQHLSDENNENLEESQENQKR